MHGLLSPAAAPCRPGTSRLTDPRLPTFHCAPAAPATPVLAALRHGADGDIPLPLLAGPLLDVWSGVPALRSGMLDGVRWVDDGEVVFLHLVVADAAWRRDPAAATEAAYRQLEAARRACAAPHWWRLWNYLGGIVEGEGDAERYRQFTLGRHRAWTASGQLDTALPAATAIGCASGLHVFALAGRSPAEAIENPRQTSAWRYPRDYGEKPPSFARASLVQRGGAGWLFVSGTASIVGFESCHVGDVAAQFAEARINLDAVVTAAAQRAGLDVACLRPRNFKLYWSRAEDAVTYAVLAQQLSALAPTQVLHGTVCRRELAVEIEALYELAAAA